MAEAERSWALIVFLGKCFSLGNLSNKGDRRCSRRGSIFAPSDKLTLFILKAKYAHSAMIARVLARYCMIM